MKENNTEARRSRWTIKRWRCNEWVVKEEIKKRRTPEERMKGWGAWRCKGGRQKKTIDEEINGRWGVKKWGSDRRWMKGRRRNDWCGRRDRGMEEGGAEASHNWPDSGRWYGAVAGWSMCVGGGGLRGRGHWRDGGSHQLGCIILTVEHLNAFIREDSKMLHYSKSLYFNVSVKLLWEKRQRLRVRVLYQYSIPLPLYSWTYTNSTNSTRSLKDILHLTQQLHIFASLWLHSVDPSSIHIFLEVLLSIFYHIIMKLQKKNLFPQHK